MYLDVYVIEGIDRQSRLFVCFVALRPKSTGMVMAVRSGHLHVTKPFQVLRAHVLSLVTGNKPSLGRRMNVEIIS